MAAAIVTTTPTGTGIGGLPGYQVGGSISISASPATYTAGGIAMNLNQAAIKASRTPISVEVTGQAGYIYRYVKGSDNSNGLLRIYAQTNGAAEDAPLGELTDASAIPTAVSGDTIQFNARYAGML